MTPPPLLKAAAPRGAQQSDDLERFSGGGDVVDDPDLVADLDPGPLGKTGSPHCAASRGLLRNRPCGCNSYSRTFGVGWDDRCPRASVGASCLEVDHGGPL